MEVGGAEPRKAEKIQWQLCCLKRVEDKSFAKVNFDEVFLFPFPQLLNQMGFISSFKRIHYYGRKHES